MDNKECIKECVKECAICASNYTSYMRRAIKCEYCDFEACKECCSTYLLNVNTPGCMSPACTGEWSREFISDNLTKAFASTKLMQHKANMLYQEQLTWMPDTQTEVEEDRRQNRIRNEIYALDAQKRVLRASLHCQISVLGARWRENVAEIRDIEHKMYVLKREFKRERYKAERNEDLIETVKTQVRECKRSIVSLNKVHAVLYDKFLKDQTELTATTIGHQLDELTVQIEILNQQRQDKTPAAAKSQFVRKCADPECHGFLSTRWKCGLCDKWTCSDCHEIKAGGDHEEDDDHKCDPNNVATAQLLSKDTKGCPKCQTPITHGGGCDQMWCVQCHVAFSWKTGQIETKIHNPHYYEWRRKNGGLAREPGDIVCGNELDNDLPIAIHDALLDKHYQTETVTEFNDMFLYISDVVRNCLHLQYVTIPSFRQGNNLTFAQRTNAHRKAYLTNLYTLEKFKQQVERLDRKVSLDTENEQVTTMLLDAMKEILFRFKASAESENCDIKILDEIYELVKYANHCLMRIGVSYTTASVYHFTETIGCGMVKTDRKAL
jgi:hypothetical protein